MSTAVLMSDIRVKFKDNTFADILQKSYVIGNFIAAGFAGSVKIGFELLQGISQLMPAEARAGTFSCDPVEVVNAWQPVAHAIFEKSSIEEKENGAQLLLVGVSPWENMGAPEWPKIYLIRMQAPLFKPMFFKTGLRMCSIGTGAKVREYHQTIRPLFRHTSGINQAHLAGLHNWAETLAASVTLTMRRDEKKEYSQSFHVIGIAPGNIVEATNNMTTYPKIGPPLVVQMPRVARSWQEFDEMASMRRRSSASATC